MTETPQTPDDDLAAEYVLRLLSGAELAAAETRLRRDPEFARIVTDWEIRLAALAEDLGPINPDTHVKKRLMSGLFPDTKTRSVWQRAGLWQAITLVALVAVAGLAWLQVRPGAPTGGPIYSAEIVAEAGDFRFVALVDKTEDEITLVRTSGQPPEGRILQVWAHGPDKPAQSVGLWPDGESVRLALPEEISMVEGVLTVGVSEEPPGGSTTGAPSGRVIGTVDISNVSANF